MHSKFYKVAEITIQLISDYPVCKNTFHPKFQQFEILKPGTDVVKIFHHFHRPIFSDQFKQNKTEIYKNSQFHIFKTENFWIYHYTSIYPLDSAKTIIGLMNKDYSTIHIYAESLLLETYCTGLFNSLSLFNTDQMILAKLLSDRNGIMIHANGFIINGNGTLFAGVSGSGKSTLSAMLKKQNHLILCDDRMLIRRKNNDFWIYGNWCYGSHPDKSPSTAPLKGFFFLEKSQQNEIIEIKQKKQIISRLMQVLVKPLLDVDGWEKYFLTIKALVTEVKFFKIEFDLSGDISHIINDFFKE